MDISYSLFVSNEQIWFLLKAKAVNYLNCLWEYKEGNEQEEKTIYKSCQHFSSHITRTQNILEK